jgi:hypothetical protein
MKLEKAIRCVTASTVFRQDRWPSSIHTTFMADELVEILRRRIGCDRFVLVVQVQAAEIVSWQGGDELASVF